MSSPITPSEILAALEGDLSYGRPEVIAQIRNYAVSLPTVLDARLEQPATPEAYFEAKYQFLTWALQEGYNYRTSDATTVSEVLAEWIRDPAQAFDFAETDRSEYMLSNHVELLPELKVLYRRGNLTIGDLVRHQPALFFP